MKTLKYNQSFKTEAGTIFPAIDIAYDTWGKLNATADNVIWVCHALTANSDVESWWPGMVGKGLLLDPEKYFIVCANILGSCYGTTGPASVNPETGKPWLRDFPLITFRDLVNVHEILRNHLGIRKIHSIIGSSIGGYQALEYCIMQPDVIKRLILIASNAKQSPWAIALNESQRLALEADQSFMANDPEGGKKGMKAARSIGLISYRTSTAYNMTQKEDDEEKISSFKASSYQAYQGDKLVKRFNPYSYWSLLQLADTHNVGRGRDGVINALKEIKSNALCVGIKSDILYPVDEQKFVAANINNAEYVEIESFYGHDGFLIETKIVTDVIRKFWEKTSNLKK
jgi:homoserine O-acetyltransferase